MREFTDAERAWVSRRYPELVPPALRPETVLWTWPEPPKDHGLHDPRPPIVGTQFLWDGDVVAEEALLRLGGSVDWEQATRWHYEPESFVPVAKQAADGSLRYIVTDHLGTPREMFDEAGRLRWAVSLTTWGVVRRVVVPPAPDNDAGRVAIYPRGRGSGNVALKAEPDAGAYACRSGSKGSGRMRRRDYILIGTGTMMHLARSMQALIRLKSMEGSVFDPM